MKKTILAILILTLFFFFKCKLGWRGFWWLSLANGLSVACVFASLLILPD